MPVDTPSKVNLTSPVAPRPLPEFLSTEEPLLRRYNHNHELPLSLATAVGLHLVALLVVAIAGVVWLGFGPGNIPPDTGWTIMEAPMSASGDGAKGQDGGFQDAKEPPKENYIYGSEPKSVGGLERNPDSFAAEMNELPRVLADTLTTDHRSNGKDPSKRPGPPGTSGPGLVGPRDLRQARKDRWEIVLPMQDSAQFLRKLKELDAILMVPDEPGRFGLYDLAKRSATKSATMADLKQLNRIWYTNRVSLVCQGVADELGLAQRPEFFAIFIPQEVENEMFAKERAFRGLSEAQLIEKKLVTQFDIARRSGGGWDVSVRKQEPRTD